MKRGHEAEWTVHHLERPGFRHAEGYGRRPFGVREDRERAVSVPVNGSLEPLGSKSRESSSDTFHPSLRAKRISEA